MCNEYARKKSLDELLAEFASVFDAPPLFEWENDHTPNDLSGKASVKIRDTAPIFRLRDDRLVASMTPWAWPGPGGKPVFNFKSEGRDFSRNDRVLIFADAFFEYTAPLAPKVKLKDKHQFTMAGQDWFWIAGIVKEGCFSMLTASPGPDVAPYHDRGIIPLAPKAGLDWLTLARPQAALLAPPPAGSLTHTLLRRDGTDLAA
ncbi:MAG: SOS response-associated peptidase [Phenylobacterium sp.]|uniref:SOS response-associated peptidase family protein n=1 Tax=Phenylobacterium sp. TaxID=1871053 RepID=UPI00272937BA|nr:SOS response-associated peptidase family protein [Phenylobacterium sp.]MDO8913908.1 SOS response-associated peptidase [Phenylobacterium sp.]MDP2012341.1 SOS response-associated peptidase [Phenylobacterium sp.]MDP3100409.1 SOS response-associated peptidase [Phenylobacterium sp.]MDP3866736.1 SOS response-associated peptidase [Phenylobacterium sp.]HQT55294.1 SOS response-associated peptidase [Phenylobacterium sp.]